MVELPLAGIRVLDITVVWSGPSSTRFMAALGAEVIRVESIRYYPNVNRGQVPYPDPKAIAAGTGMSSAYPGKDPGPDPYNRFGPFMLTSQGKLSCTMELDTPEGREAFHRLVAQSDVVVENNSRALSSQLGLEWEELSAVNPGLILVKMTPLGMDGPYSAAIGFGAHFEALVGMAALRKHPDAAPDDAGATYHMDDVAPHGVVFSVLAALSHRERTGRGQLIEFPQATYLMQGLGDVFLAVAQNPDVPVPADGNRHSAWVQGLYPCAGQDEWIALSLRDDDEWSAFVDTMGNPPWASDARFATSLSRRENQDELDPLIGALTAQHTKHDLFAKLQENGVPAGPVYNEADAYADPHFADRGIFRPVEHPAGTYSYPSFGARYSGMDLQWGRPAPLVGQDNEYVYCDLLGYSADEYQEFLDKNLAGTSYPRPTPPG